MLWSEVEGAKREILSAEGFFASAECTAPAEDGNRRALKPFNIHVSQIEVGFLKTPMMDKRQVAAEPMREYDPWRQRSFNAIRDYEEKGPGPELVAETVLKIIASKTPKLRYVIGRQAKVVSRLRQFLPEGACLPARACRAKPTIARRSAMV